MLASVPIYSRMAIFQRLSAATATPEASASAPSPHRLVLPATNLFASSHLACLHAPRLLASAAHKPAPCIVAARRRPCLPSNSDSPRPAPHARSALRALRTDCRCTVRLTVRLVGLAHKPAITS